MSTNAQGRAGFFEWGQMLSASSSDLADPSPAKYARTPGRPDIKEAVLAMMATAQRAKSSV
ncbi:hypothetical protein [Burkholderia cepacia]|uniref:hypothetical protein n=1 Tax=Burkholderia cepacia TaxID=292 RepID=UPI00298FD30B|nr:hypothetical protein [Burkholderia cepacia]